jgi:hypothetical protein
LQLKVERLRPDKCHMLRPRPKREQNNRKLVLSEVTAKLQVLSARQWLCGVWPAQQQAYAQTQMPVQYNTAHRSSCTAAHQTGLHCNQALRPHAETCINCTKQFTRSVVCVVSRVYRKKPYLEVELLNLPRQAALHRSEEDGALQLMVRPVGA